MGSGGSRGLLLLVSSALALGAAELWVRTFRADEVDRQALERVAAGVSTAAFTRPSRHRELAFELRPGTRIEWMGVPLAIDDQDPRRIPLEGPAEPPDAIRVALVGDSTPFGWGVAWEDSYGERLRRALEAFAGRPVALRNYATPGYNTHHNRVTLEDRVLAWRPQLVVLHYDHNDADPILTKPHGYMPPEFGDNPLHSSLLKWARRRLHGWRLSRFTSAVESPDGAAERFFHAYRFAGPQFERHMGELETTARLAGDAGVPVLVVIFNAWIWASPDPMDDPWYTTLHEPLVRRLEALGLGVVDLYPSAQRLMAERGWPNLTPLWQSRSDPHPTPGGHAFVADEIFRAIRSQPSWSRIFRPSEGPAS